MWSFRSEEIERGSGNRYWIERDGVGVTFAEVIQGWEGDAQFRLFFNEVLAGAPLSAFRWETPGVTGETVSREFEFVLLDSPDLERRADAGAFAEYFDGNSEGMVTFPNLGRSAVLVVPCPVVTESAYGHLAAFVREAPEAQRDALWQAVGAAMRERLGERRVWLSTAGAGVAWLHVRLDDRPKYYRFGEYR